MKKCSKCKEVKSLDSFHENKAKKDGLRYQCKDCVRYRSVEYTERSVSLRGKDLLDERGRYH